MMMDWVHLNAGQLRVEGGLGQTQRNKGEERMKWAELGKGKRGCGLRISDGPVMSLLGPVFDLVWWYENGPNSMQYYVLDQFPKEGKPN
ncbi:hypothetical protein Droror1_Dr00015229 [Drosera rotundifolia]